MLTRIWFRSAIDTWLIPAELASNNVVSWSSGQQHLQTICAQFLSGAALVDGPPQFRKWLVQWRSQRWVPQRQLLQYPASSHAVDESSVRLAGTRVLEGGWRRRRCGHRVADCHTYHSDMWFVSETCVTVFHNGCTNHVLVLVMTGCKVWARAIETCPCLYSHRHLVQTRKSFAQRNSHRYAARSGRSDEIPMLNLLNVFLALWNFLSRFFTGGYKLLQHNGIDDCLEVWVIFQIRQWWESGRNDQSPLFFLTNNK